MKFIFTSQLFIIPKGKTESNKQTKSRMSNAVFADGTEMEFIKVSSKTNKPKKQKKISKSQVQFINSFMDMIIKNNKATKALERWHIDRIIQEPKNLNVSISIKINDAEVDPELERRALKQEIYRKQAQETERELIRKLEEEETKASQPKAKKEKKQKDKVEKPKTNPHPKQIKISEGIWKTNPKWVKWEKENK